jgi:hypothetical protein
MTTCPTHLWWYLDDVRPLAEHNIAASRGPWSSPAW